MPGPSRFGTFLVELRRRRVYRVAAVYGVVAWLIIQVAATTFPALGIPAWALRLVIVLVLLGFPVALGLAWAFDVTSDGLRRTAPLASAPRGPGAPASRAPRWAGVLAVVALSGGAAYSLYARRATAEDAPSIAVLPFENFSGDPEDGYFSAGITEDILSHLAGIQELRVVSRTSASRYGTSDRSLREIGDELGVRTILEGSVRREGTRIRIVAQLIDARSDEHIWAETFDREITDVFAIQSEIARTIARELRAKLTPAEERRIENAPTRNVEAYDLYLKARPFAAIVGVGQETNEFAIALLKRAVSLDPNFAAAHALLGYAYSMRGGTWVDSGLVAARRSIALAPEAGTGYYALGGIYRRSLGRASEARRLYQRALGVSPNDADVLTGLGILDRQTGRYPDAVAHLKRALSLGPADVRNTARYAHLAAVYADLAMYAEAERVLQEGLEREPASTLLQSERVWLTLQRGDYERARTMLDAFTRNTTGLADLYLEGAWMARYAGDLASARRYLELHRAHPDAGPSPRTPLLEWMLGDRASAAALEAREARLLRLIADGADSPQIFVAVAQIAASRGDAEKAIAYLEDAVDRGYRWHWQLRKDPVYESVRADPRFARLLARVEEDVTEMRRAVGPASR